MAKSTTGKWVSRVGASGGGKAYKKSRPSNYYGALVLIVVLGIAATVLARYDYQHPHHTVGTPPAIGTTWYAALRIENCGQAVTSMTPDASFLGGFQLLSNNVIKIKPVSAADSGNNATVAQFANEYPGLIVSNSQIAVPGPTGQPVAKTTFRNGNTCATGTKYAGQAAHVSYAYWRTFGQTKPTVTSNPSTIKFSQYMRITMAYDPSGVTPQPPSKTTVDAMVSDGSSPSTTTTPVVATTTPPAATTTTASTTTTAPAG